MMTREGLKNLSYLIGHAGVVWIFSIWQIVHIYATKSSEDIVPFWVGALLFSHIFALPRSLTSGYKVWWVCHLVSMVLLTILLVGVILYGG